MRRGGMLANFVYRSNVPIFEDGLAYVTVEGQQRRAVIGHSDFLRITARDPGGPFLTRTRWFLDDANMLRAYSLHDDPMTHGVLVVAAVLGANEGDTLEIPEDPFDVRLSSLRRVAA